MIESKSIIPASVIIVTKNESKSILQVINHLTSFDDVWVVDSKSADKTAELAQSCNVKVVNFEWNGQYPKKRQWCLDHLNLKYDWVLFIDADEEPTVLFLDEIRNLLSRDVLEAGFFITARYKLNGKVLKYGFPNRKIALLHKEKMEFPVVDDLDIPGMGEIEGHYQPILKNNADVIGTLKNYMIHNALENERSWIFRHEKYARWESGMNAKGAWPIDPIAWREMTKKFLRLSPFRAEIIFIVGLIFKAGYMDGKDGLYFLKMRYAYLKMIRALDLSRR